VYASTSSSNTGSALNAITAQKQTQTVPATATTSTDTRAIGASSTIDEYNAIDERFNDDDDNDNNEHDSDTDDDDDYNIIGVESGLREAARRHAELIESNRNYAEENPQDGMRSGNLPFKKPYFTDCGRSVLSELTHVVELFSNIIVVAKADDNAVTKTAYIDNSLLQGYAVEQATEVCDDNTAEKLVYAIQQLMLKEQDQRYELMIGRPPRKNPKNTTFQDLEAWAVKDSDGTVTVDTDKLQISCDYVKEQAYSTYEYPWADTLLKLNKEFFSKGREGRVHEVLVLSLLGQKLLMCYLDSSRLTQLSQLPSLWNYDRHYVLTPRWTYSMDRAMAIATKIQMLGHIVVDYGPGAESNRSPSLTSKMVPDYEGIPIKVHNLFVIGLY
jgi:hypothetical protein